MPELPEVETVARSLRPAVLGKVLKEVWWSGLALRQPVDLPALRRQRGSRIEALDRIGKNLLFRLSSGRVLLAHLGMSGHFLLAAPGEPAAPHTHLRFRLAGCSYELRYLDPRRFGCAVLRRAGEIPELDALGPDPLTERFTPAYLAGALAGSRRDLKALLLDQGVVAGLGNIYVAEALFHAGLRPTRRADTVPRRQVPELHRAIVSVLLQAVERRGTTLSDSGYVDAAGRQGDNREHLRVYGRGGAPCHACGAPIARRVQGQRSSFYCPRCQR